MRYTGVRRTTVVAIGKLKEKENLQVRNNGNEFHVYRQFDRCFSFCFFVVFFIIPTCLSEETLKACIKNNKTECFLM